VKRAFRIDGSALHTLATFELSGILALLLGRRLCDRYRVDSVIATGGMGSVCRAFDLKLERSVAVKVVTAVVPDEDEAGRLRARFHREATAAARLRHPNVVTVHDFGTDPGLGIDFLVMEMLAGEDLAARMRRARGPLPVDEAVEILREAGLGLAAGHRAGMVHRDVKPANIYLVAEPGGWEVKVLDFGIAQVRSEAGADTATRLTQYGAPHTPRYASPEQLNGGSVTAASDVYSLAFTGLEMLGGEHPEGLNATGDDREAARTVKRILARRPEIPIRLAAVLRRAVRLDPAARFADADAFLDALDDWEKTPPADPAAAGYASILPGATGPARTSRSAPAPPAPSSPTPSAEDDGDRTILADRPAFNATAFAPPPLPPMVMGDAPRAGDANGSARAGDAQAANAGAGSDAPAEANAKPRRRFRIRPAGWLVLAMIVALLAAWLFLGHPGRVGDRGGSSSTRSDLPIPRVVPAGGWDLAPTEYARVTGGGEFRAGDAVYVVMLASFTPEQIERARDIRDRVKRHGYDVGLANGDVYPELRDGYIVLVAGPYPTREEAEVALPDLQRDGAGDAFLKRVTIRKPPAQ
jgi:serine/threonine protein kinase